MFDSPLHDHVAHVHDQLAGGVLVDRPVVTGGLDTVVCLQDHVELVCDHIEGGGDNVAGDGDNVEGGGDHVEGGGGHVDRVPLNALHNNIRTSDSVDAQM